VQAGALSASPIHGRNQWPHQDAAFEAQLRAYIASMTQLGRVIMTGIARGLGLPPTFFEGRGEPYWVVRVIHYPPLPAQADGEGAGAAEGERCRGRGACAADALSGADVPRSPQLSCGEHTDYGLLTIVNQEAGINALQVKNARGEWIIAEPLPGALLIAQQARRPPPQRPTLTH